MEQTTVTQKTCEVRAYTTKQLYTLYGVNDKTFRKWLEPFWELLGEKRGIYFNLRQVELIFDKLGVPGKIYQYE